MENFSFLLKKQKFEFYRFIEQNLRKAFAVVDYCISNLLQRCRIMVKEISW